jgi:hypothetical protein
MHGGSTAVFAVVLRALGTHRPYAQPLVWLPALLAASVLHASFNRFLSQPIVATALMIIALPVVLRVVYILGERRLQRWLGQGFDHDSELLALIKSGEVGSTPLGRYLASLRSTFPRPMVGDMLCLLRLQAELSLRAKGVLLLKQNGLPIEPDPTIAEKLTEVRWLEKSLGRAGLLAMRPVCRWRGANRWQRHLLDEEAAD